MTFKDAAKAFDDVAEYLDKVGEADGKNIDEAAKKIGIDLDRAMVGPTPLAPTIREAQIEKDTKALTKGKQISDAVSKKIGELAP